MASGDLARMRDRDSDSGDDDRVKMLILMDPGDLIDGVLGNDEYLFRFVNTPLRGGDGGLSSGEISLMLGGEPLRRSGRTSSKARRPLSEETGVESFELLTQLRSLRSSGGRAVVGSRSSSVGGVITGGTSSGLSVGRSGNWFLDESSATSLTVLSGNDCCFSEGTARMVDGGKAPSLV